MFDTENATIGGAETAAPIRVVLSREQLESEHVVDAVVLSRTGVVAAYGDTQRSVIARSSLKPIQVVPLLTSGAAAAYDVTDQEIALAAASHSGEVAHLEAVSTWLTRIGLDEMALECGATRPLSVVEADRVAASASDFAPIHNCCSGKHAGFLTIAQHLGVDPTGYIERSHPVQQLVVEAIERFTGCSLDGSPHGIDGCGIPTFSLPLEALAMSMVRLADPSDLDTLDADAARHVVRALSSNPFWLSGSERREVQLTEVASESMVIKTGAEGVFMAALPARRLGIALKVRDGATRAANLAIAAVLEELGAIPTGHAVAPVTNAAGTVVGTMEALLS